MTVIIQQDFLLQLNSSLFLFSFIVYIKNNPICELNLLECDTVKFSSSSSQVPTPRPSDP